MLRSRMSRTPVSKELWKQLEPLIPPFVPSRKGGRRKLTISDDGCPQSHLVCSPNWHCMGRLASSFGLRQRHDVLAAFA